MYKLVADSTLASNSETNRVKQQTASLTLPDDYIGQRDKLIATIGEVHFRLQVVPIVRDGGVAYSQYFLVKPIILSWAKRLGCKLP